MGTFGQEINLNALTDDRFVLFLDRLLEDVIGSEPTGKHYYIADSAAGNKKTFHAAQTYHVKLITRLPIPTK